MLKRKSAKTCTQDKPETKVYKSTRISEDADPNHYRYLTDEQYDILDQYLHHAPKTWLEAFIIDNFAVKIEEYCIPNCLTANPITMIGNTMLYVACGIMYLHGGASYHSGVEVPSWVFYFGAFSLQWFSWWDMFDGCRARRLKCGTPIGRIIDEGGDMVQYTFFTFLIGYVIQVAPGWLTLSYGLINMAMYSMEMQFILCGELNIITAAEIGPVEIELFLSAILFCAGCFGVTGMTQPFINYLPSFAASFIPETFLCNEALCYIFVFLNLMFIVENTWGCFANPKVKIQQIMYILASPLLVFGGAFAGAYCETETFKNQFVWYNVLHQMVLNIKIYKLMIANMTNSSYELLGIENLIGMLPILVHLASPSKSQKELVEPLASYISIVALFVCFYGHVILLSRQYLARDPKRSFFFILKQD